MNFRLKFITSEGQVVWVSPSTEDAHAVVGIRSAAGWPTSFCAFICYLWNETTQSFDREIANSNFPAVCNWVATPEGLDAMAHMNGTNQSIAKVVPEFEALMRATADDQRVFLASQLWIEASLLA